MCDRRARLCLLSFVIGKQSRPCNPHRPRARLLRLASQRPPAPSAVPVLIGADWADPKHLVCLIDPQAPRRQGRRCEELEQRPETVAAWAARFRRRFPERPLWVIVERSRGALIHALLATGQFLLYPVNPKQLARFREALYPSGTKNDPNDAQLLAQFLMPHGRQLRPLRPDAEAPGRIADLAQQRASLVQSIEQFDKQLKTAVAQHEDAEIFRSPPGAGDVLGGVIAAFGSDRDRWHSAAEIQQYSGIAPVTQQSGRSHIVRRRYACPPFTLQLQRKWRAGAVRPLLSSCQTVAATSNARCHIW